MIAILNGLDRPLQQHDGDTFAADHAIMPHRTSSQRVGCEVHALLMGRRLIHAPPTSNTPGVFDFIQQAMGAMQD